MSEQRFDVMPHLEALRRYARVLTRFDPDADDLVQAALLHAYERRHQFRPGANLRPWLMSILHRLFVDRLRSRSAEQDRSRAWAGQNPGFASPGGEQAARLAQLRRAFLMLPEEQREALHLVAIEGFSVAEAAAVLDCPQGTVMSRLGRARAAIRQFEDGRAEPVRPMGLRLVGGRDDETG